MVLFLTFLLLLQFFVQTSQHSQYSEIQPVRIAVAGLSHDHVHWLLGRDNEKNDIQLVGIYEPNVRLQERYAETYNLDRKLFYTDLDKMFIEAKPEGVTAFGSTFSHLELVKKAAPRKIHVMVEKPLAVNFNHARQMKELAETYNIHLVTNYETTWYASTHQTYHLIHSENKFGKIRKIVSHYGHQGPKEIGVSNEFLHWLTDPHLNGGGAIMDFGCYGANLITWLMDGAEPLSVTAVTQTHKPEIYPNVDDEATIILTYPEAQGIIQASWNWPYNRKDMTIYGQNGTVTAHDNLNLSVLKSSDEQATPVLLEPRSYPYNDPFSYFAAVIRNNISVQKSDLSSLSNNLTVMKILDAAKKSAESGKTVILNN